MSNSKLISYTKISPNRTSPRNHIIDTVTIHCVVGQLSVETMGNMFAQPSYQASCNYAIGSDGRIALIVSEDDRSWCSSNRDNDNRAVTIECASDKTHPYAVNSKVYVSLIDLLTDICKRNGIRKLLWKGDKSLIGQVDKQNMTVHRWFVNKACPGDYLYSRHGRIAAEVNARLEGASQGFQASDLQGMTEAERIAKIAPLYVECMKKTGLLASVGIAQFCLESGYGTTDLAQFANNLHGMKCSLSGNTWAGSVWDGTSKYGKYSPEVENGVTVQRYSEFRKYACCEDSIADRAAYFANAMSDSQKRYPGLVGETDYKKAIQIIKAGGYATDPQYVSKLCCLVERWELFKYDEGVDMPDNAAGDILPETEQPWYRVRRSWTDAKSQIGAYHDFDKAKACADQNPGCSVFDESGKAVYMSVPTKEYKVQIGSFTQKSNAEKLFRKAKKAGFDVIVKKENGQYKVQCGSFTVKGNADALVKKLKAAGFAAIIK